MEEFLEGYQNLWPRFIGVSNISDKIVKYVMGCEIFGVFQTAVKIMYSFTTKV